jgi:hypothetical protein
MLSEYNNYCSLEVEGGTVCIRISGATFSELSSITVNIEDGMDER